MARTLHPTKMMTDDYHSHRPVNAKANQLPNNEDHSPANGNAHKVQMRKRQTRQPFAEETDQKANKANENQSHVPSRTPIVVPTGTAPIPPILHQVNRPRTTTRALSTDVRLHGSCGDHDPSLGKLSRPFAHLRTGDLGRPVTRQERATVASGTNQCCVRLLFGLNIPESLAGVPVSPTRSILNLYQFSDGKSDQQMSQGTGAPK